MMAFGANISAADLRDQLQKANEASDPYAQIELIRRILDHEPDTVLREQLANLWLQIGDYDMAERTIAEWKDAPDTVRAHVLAEVLFKRDEKYDEAIAMLENSLNTRSEIELVRQLTGYLNARGNSPKVIELLTTSPGVSEQPDLLVARAGAKRSMLDLEGAVEDFSTANRLYPEDSSVSSNRVAYERIKASLSKIRDATEAMDQQPSEVWPVFTRAYWYLYAGAGLPALKDAEAAQKLAPQSVAVLLLVNQTKGLLGQLSSRDAMEQSELDISKNIPSLDESNRLLKYDAILAQRPENIASLVGRSSELVGLQQYRRALSDANAALQADPKNAAAYVLKLRCLIKLGQRDNAEAALRDFIAIKPAKDQLASTLSDMTEDAFSASQLEQALEYINQAIELKPTSQSYKQRAAILQRLGRSEEAQADIAKAQQSGGRR